MATVLATLMMLHFLIDQVQKLACPLFKAARNGYYSRRQRWELRRTYGFLQVLPSWEVRFKLIIYQTIVISLSSCPIISLAKQQG
ncbi:MAG: hypothetical protein BWK78_02890 [Thiotrichaceae bacterium IS1]|nr:MAG: hypothetical protein BWK78_02890 [Thiotrichaceae bacterium IS1]